MIRNLPIPAIRTLAQRRVTPAILALAIAAGIQTPGYAAMQNLLAGEHKVIGMYINAGNANQKQIAGGTDTTVDQAAIYCPQTSCTLALSAMQEVEDGDGTHEWQIIALVDGQNVGPQWQGILPTNYYITGNWQGKYAVAKGSHTVTFQIFGEAPDFLLDSWADSVTITAP
jgi:hypothetical protein